MRTKDTYWFRHDSNAKDDFKCMLLIEQLGCEGYGIFWILVETLREQKDYKYPLALLNALARKYNTTQAKMETVVNNYQLFEIENETFFFSNSLNIRMSNLDKIKEQRKIAGQKSGQARRKKAIEHKLNNCSTDAQKNKKDEIEQMFNGCSTDVERLDKIRIEEEKEEDIKQYLLKLQKDEFEFEAEISLFVEYLLYGKSHKVESKLFYTKRIVENLLNFEAETLANFQDFLKNKDSFIFQTKGA